MRFAVVGVIALLATTFPVFGQVSVTRPTATLTLVRNDDGTGTPTPKHWAIYAEVTSPGYAGIYAFGVDLVDGSVTSIESLSPEGTFIDSSGIKKPRPIGFSTIRGVLLDKAKFYAAQEMINSDAIMEYSFGLSDGRLDKAEGLPVVNAAGNPIQWTLEDSVQSSYRAHLLMGAGTFDEVLPTFQDGSADNVISVFLNSDGRRSQRTDLTLVTLDLLSRVAQNSGSIPEPALSSALILTTLFSLRLRRARQP